MPDIFCQHRRGILNAVLNQTAWKYHTCHSSGALWEISAHVGTREAMWQPSEGGWIWMQTGRARHAFEYRWPYMHTFFIVGWITWIAYEPMHLAGVAMDTGPHSLPPALSLLLSFYHTCTHISGLLKSWRCEFQRYPVKYFAAEVQYQAAAARQGSVI